MNFTIHIQSKTEGQCVENVEFNSPIQLPYVMNTD